MKKLIIAAALVAMTSPAMAAPTSHVSAPLDYMFVRCAQTSFTLGMAENQRKFMRGFEAISNRGLVQDRKIFDYQSGYISGIHMAYSIINGSSIRTEARRTFDLQCRQLVRVAKIEAVGK